MVIRLSLNSKKLDRIPPFLIQKALQTAQELESKGEKLIHLETGEPEVTTPQHIINAAYDAMQKGFTHYTSSRGILELRQAIAQRLSVDYGLEANPKKEILPTPGAKYAIFCSILATVEEGQEVIIATPHWTAYENAIICAGAVPVMAHLKELDSSFSLDIETIERAITERTRIIAVNLPNNPTGAVATDRDVEDLADIVKKHDDMLVLSDEVYDKLAYDGHKHICLKTHPGLAAKTILVGSLSKSYAMTGWRLGYAVADERIISAMVKIQEGTTTHPTSFVQKAGVAALQGPQDHVEGMRKEYETRRRVLVGGLNEIPGVKCGMPQGAMFAFPDVSKITNSSLELSEYLLREAKVVTVPGIGFGNAGEGHLRLSFSNTLENIDAALENIKAAMEKLPVNLC